VPLSGFGAKLADSDVRPRRLSGAIDSAGWFQASSGHLEAERREVCDVLKLKVIFPMTTTTAMTRDQIVSVLRDLLRQQKQVKIDASSVSLESRLDRIGFDSLSILDFMYDVEDRFKVRMEIADLVRMHYVKDLIEYLEGKLAG